MFASWSLDIRHSLRRLWHSPFYLVTGAISLAIGIGAATAVFSIGQALLLSPVPGIHRAAELLDVGRTQSGRGFDTAAYPNYLDLQSRTQTLEGIYAYNIEPAAMSLGSAENSERIYGTVVSGNYFEVLGVRPLLGRLLRPNDDQPDSVPLAVLSEPLWRTYFHRDPEIIGRTVMLNGQPVAIVGVAPAGFAGTTVLREDLWLPISAVTVAMPRLSPDILHQREGAWLMMGARRKSGISISQVNAELSALGSALAKDFPEANRDRNYRAVALSKFPGRTNVVGAFLGLLLAMVSLVLVVASANFVSMTLARVSEQEHAYAIRMALGAGRFRLVVQSLCETLAVFLLGGAIGLLLTNWLVHFLISFVPQLPFPIAIDPTIDWRVIGFSTLVTVVAALLSGLAGAFRTASATVLGSLKASSDAAPEKMRLRDLFVAGQIALSLLLVILAGQFIRAVVRAVHIDPGFDQRRVEVIPFDLSLGGYKGEAGERFLSGLLDRVRSIPDVESASAAADLPLDGERMGVGEVRAPGAPDAVTADANVVEPGVFNTLRVRLLHGRDFNHDDRAKSLPVVIVNQSLAHRLWPGQDALGKQLELVEPLQKTVRKLTIIGVADNVYMESLSEAPGPYLYVPLAQYPMARLSLLVRSKSGSSVAPDVRRIVHGMNGSLPVAEPLPLSSITAIELLPQRIAAAVSGTLGGVGVLLASIGIFGVTSYAVSRRRREIAIRIAVGADYGDILRFVLRRTAVLVGGGFAVGGAIAIFGSRALESFLLGVGSSDGLAYAGAFLLFGTVAAFAAYLPARRALEVNPVDALRSE